MKTSYKIYSATDEFLKTNLYYLFPGFPSVLSIAPSSWLGQWFYKITQMINGEQQYYFLIINTTISILIFCAFLISSAGQDFFYGLLNGELKDLSFTFLIISTIKYHYIMTTPTQNFTIWNYLSGREYIPATAHKSYTSGVHALGMASLFTALLFAVSIACYIHLHIRYLTVSCFVAVAAGLLILLFNRFMFQNSSEGFRQAVPVWIGFLLFYGMLVFIFPEPFSFWYLQPEILQSKSVTGSSLSLFSQMIKVENTLGVEQNQSLQNFKLYLMLVAGAISLIPPVSHFLLTRKEHTEEFLEIQDFRNELIHKIYIKKMELATIYEMEETPVKKNEDPFAGPNNEETQSPDRQSRIDQLYKEIAHLERLLETL